MKITLVQPKYFNIWESLGLAYIGSYLKNNFPGKLEINFFQGYFDAYQEEDIYIWDVAAGLALISESGGIYEIKTGSSESKFNVYASNNCLI